MKARRFLVGVVALHVLGMAAGSSHASIDPRAIVGIWLFDEGEGGVARDSSQNGNDGTLLPPGNGPQWTTQGKFGGALEFNGAGAYIEFATGESMKTPHFTIMAWFNTRKLNGYGHIFQTGRDWNDMAGYVLRVHQDGTAQAGLAFGPGNATTFVTGPALNDDTWYHMALTFDGTTATLYLDGAVAATGAGQGEIMYDNQPVRIGVHSQDTGAAFDGFIDEVALFDVALEADDIQSIIDTGLAEIIGGVAVATNPQPVNGATDVPQDAVLSWTPGEYPGTHDVYFGTALADVNSATRADAKGILAAKGQAAATFGPPDALVYGQTYYWRIDEVNSTPDSAVHKGEVWRFTVEPYAYPVTPVTATASSFEKATTVPANTINGSGLTGDLHGVSTSTMWNTSMAASGPAWIQYQFDKAYKLSELWVWNYNGEFEPVLGYGFKDVTIEYSLDGQTWTLLKDTQFAQATAVAGYAHNTTVDMGGVVAQHVKLTANSNWSAVGLKQYGLSEVRFFYVPVQARAPQPGQNATGVAVDSTLDWRPGREATSHHVVFGSDQAAVSGGTAAAKTVTGHGFDPGELDFGTTYYWKVDEIGATTYAGALWSFTTQEYAAVDDFESYTDDEGSRIYESWIDGWTNGTGSVVGYLQAPFAETTIVHDGKQSLPMEYNNVKTPYYSEATRTFDTAQDWTTSGADTLSVWFRGQAPGFVDHGDGTFTMSSSGTDIWNNSDQFRFAYKQLTGDGSIVARVDSVANTNAWAKAGVMIRQSIEAGSVHAFMPITPGGSSAGNGASFQRRLTANGASSNDDNTAPAVAAPYWVKVERKGNGFTGSISADGKTWKQLGTAQTIAVANPVLIGLAVCSHDATLTTTAAFSNVSTTGTVTGSWQAVAIGMAMPNNGPAPLYLVVEDKAGKSKMVVHANPSASTTAAWTQWRIPLTDLTGINLAAVKKLTLGVGDKADPKAGTAGTMFFDDIGYGHPVK